MAHRHEEKDCHGPESTRVMIHKQTGHSCNIWRLEPSDGEEKTFKILLDIDEAWFW